MSNYLPSLIVNPGDPLFLGTTFGFILSIPVALFLANWLCNVKNKIEVVVGAFMGSLFGFVSILSWVNTLIFSTSLPDANGVATFFGSLFLCTVVGLMGGILTNLAVMRRYAKEAHKDLKEM